jgi:hypothetical protein
MGGQHRNVEDQRPGWWALAGVGFGILALTSVFLIWFPWWGALLLATNAIVIATLALMLDYFVGWGRIWKELTGR